MPHRVVDSAQQVFLATPELRRLGEAHPGERRPRRHRGATHRGVSRACVLGAEDGTTIARDGIGRERHEVLVRVPAPLAAELHPASARPQPREKAAVLLGRQLLSLAHLRTEALAAEPPCLGPRLENALVLSQAKDAAVPARRLTRTSRHGRLGASIHTSGGLEFDGGGRGRSAFEPARQSRIGRIGARTLKAHRQSRRYAYSRGTPSG